VPQPEDELLLGPVERREHVPGADVGDAPRVTVGRDLRAERLGPLAPGGRATSTQKAPALAARGTRLATMRCGLARRASASRSSEGSSSDTSARGRRFLTEKASASAYMGGPMAMRTRGAVMSATSFPNEARAVGARGDRPGVVGTEGITAGAGRPQARAGENAPKGVVGGAAYGRTS
jgi:hypothetical protein